MDEHEWLGGACEHEPLSERPTDVNGVVLEYFSREEPTFRALQKLVMDRNWLKSLKYYTRFRYIPYSGLISKKKFSNKHTKFMLQRIYFRTPDLNCRILLLHINFGGIYFRRETAKRNIRK